MRYSFLHVLYDICYLALLCAVILVTFCVIFLPAQPTMTILSVQALPVFQHTAAAPLSTEIAMIFAIASLLYLKCIWRFICR